MKTNNNRLSGQFKIGRCTLDPSAPQGNISLTINQGKNPTVASAVQTIFAQMGNSAGLIFDTTYVNALPKDMGNGMISTIIAMLIYLPSLITAIAISLIHKPNYKVREGRARAIMPLLYTCQEN